MIIRYTFNDNDFTQVIEKYLEEFGPYGRWVPNTDVDKIIELKNKYDDYNDKYIKDKNMTKAEYINLKKRLILELEKHFNSYIDSIQSNSNWETDGINAEHLQECKDYIKENIKIKLVRNIPDQWENGEVVYYINMHYITL